MIVCYLRVSTGMQAERNGTSGQRSDIERWLSQRGIDHASCEWIEDAGVSGATRKRPGLARLESLIESGDCEMVVAAELSRLFRSTIHMAEFVERCHPRGVAVHFARGGLEVSDTPVGRLLVTVMAAVAQMERELTVERIKSGIRSRRRSGAKWGGENRVNPDRDARIAESYDRIGTVRTAEEFNCSEVTVRAAVRRNRGSLCAPSSV